MKKIKFNLLICLSLLAFTGNAQITANWKSTGPIQFPINVSGQINGIGRITQVKFHPSDSLEIYATSASGGLWISKNGGNNWKGTGTDNLPSANCASVCIDFTNDSILYLGTGDPNYYNAGIGIWKSTDGGQSWNVSNTGIGNRLAVELLMNPTNHNELIAATNDGIWKSYNAGQNWTVKKSGGAFKDMKFKASYQSDTLFAVTSSQYYRSTDMGETWFQITNGVNVPGGNGQGMRLAVSESNPDIVYIGMIADGGTILKSTDGGNTFSTAYHNPAQMLVGYDANTPGQGNYDFGMTADPLNADNVFVVAHCVWRSNDAGVTWAKLTDWAVDCHTDMHQISYNPYNHSNLLNANDGGIFVSHDDGDTWDPLSDGLETTECYHAAQSNLVTNIVSIGTQDNGELFYDNQWKTNRGGDWTEKMAFDYQQFNRVYYFSGNRRAVNGNDQSWNSPFTGDANALLFSPLNTSLAFTATQGVYRTLNLNAGTPTWTSIGSFSGAVQTMAVSPVNANDLYVVSNNLQIHHSSNALAASPVFTTITAPSSTANAASIAVLKSNPNVIYISCGSKVYRSTNQGANWTNISFNLPAVNIRKIYLDDYSPLEAIYVCSSIGVYFKNDTMSYWANYSQGLPSIADIQDFMLTNNGTVNSKLRVAYYGRGVWESDLYQPYLLPKAEFAALDSQLCLGETAVFTNTSSANASSWSWTFPGGNPATSNLKNPIVTYAAPGIYTVSLVAYSGLGSDSIAKVGYISVQGNNSLPAQESFAGNFTPAFWTLIDAANDGINWMQATNVGGYGASAECLVFDNYNIDVQGHRDAIRTPHYDLSTVAHAELQFDLAYAVNSAPYFDTLAIYVSTDCDNSSSLVYLKDAYALATAPPSPNVTFVPTPTQWKTESVNLDAFVGQSNVSITFQNRGNTGQDLYIDNVNLSAPLKVKSIQKNPDLSVYPNPGNGLFYVALAGEKNQNYQLDVYNSIGEKISITTALVSSSSTKSIQSIRISAKGIYFLSIKNDKGILIAQEKLVVF